MVILALNTETLGKFNRRLLVAQKLTNTASGSGSTLSVANACCGVNSQNFRDSFMTFWSRSSNFNDTQLIAGFKPGGTLSRTWTVRGTVHTFPSKDYFIHVFGSPRNRIFAAHDRYARQLGLPSRVERVERLYEPLVDEIKNEAMTAQYVGEFMSERLERMGIKGKRHLARGWASQKTMGPTWEGLMEMSYLGLITNAGRKGSTNLWTSTGVWLGKAVNPPDPFECSVELIRKYIEGYGPVTPADIAYWSGHRKRDVSEIMKSLKSDLMEESFEGSKEKYYSLNGFGQESEDPPGVILLPRFDSLMMGHNDKSRVMRPELRNKVFSGAGIINPTVLLDGFVAGTWNKKAKPGSLDVTVTPFRHLSKSDRDKIRHGFSSFGDYLEARTVVSFLPVSK